MKHREIEINILQKYQDYIVSFDPVLNQIGSTKTIHSGGFRYQINEKQLVTPLDEFSFTIEISYDTISNYNLEAFTQSIYNFIEQQIAEIHNMMFRTLDKVTKLTGNVVKTGGDPLSADKILDMIDKTEIRFDNNGEPIKLSFIASPEVIKQFSGIKFTPEQGECHKQIIERKRKEYYAKKRYRRLSYIY